MNEKMIDASIHATLETLRTERVTLEHSLQDEAPLEQAAVEAQEALAAFEALPRPKFSTTYEDAHAALIKQRGESAAVAHKARTSNADVNRKIKEIDPVLSAASVAESASRDMMACAAEGAEAEAEIARITATASRINAEIQQLEQQRRTKEDAATKAALAGEVFEVPIDDIDRQIAARQRAVKTLQTQRAELVQCLPALAERAATARHQMFYAKARLARLRWAAVAQIVMPCAVATRAAYQAAGWSTEPEFPAIPEAETRAARREIEGATTAWRPTLRNTAAPTSSVDDTDSHDGEQTARAA